MSPNSQKTTRSKDRFRDKDKLSKYCSSKLYRVRRIDKRHFVTVLKMYVNEKTSDNEKSRTTKGQPPRPATSTRWESRP